MNYLIDVLLGKSDERMQRFGHDRLSVFGVGTEYSKNEWQSIFRQLVAANLLAVDITEHGGLKFTPSGHAFLKEKQTLRLRKAQAAKEKTKLKTRGIAVIPFIDDADERLFAALKALRTEIAKAQNVPPYVIFHDKTLREMAISKPASAEAFGNISGVGERKKARYSEPFLNIIIQHEANLVA